MIKTKMYIPSLIFVFVTCLIFYLIEANSIKYIGVPLCLDSNIRKAIPPTVSSKSMQEIKSYYTFYDKGLEASCLPEGFNYEKYNSLKNMLISSNIYYQINPRHVNKLVIPNCLKYEEYRRYVLNKILDPIHKSIMVKNYIYDKKNNSYCLAQQTKHNTSQIVSILVKSGYYVDLIDRGMETPVKRLLLYYMGPFFNFGYVGILNWLVLPIIIFLAFKAKLSKLGLQKQVGLLTYSLATILILVKFGHNPRYQLTLLPISTYIILITIWTHMKSYGHSLIKFVLMIFCLLIFINAFLGTIYYSRQIQKNISYIFGKTPLIRNLNIEKATNYLYVLLSRTVFNSYNKIYFSYYYLNPQFIHSFIQDKQKTITGEEITGTVTYLNTLPDVRCVLVNNIPYFYYYTDLKGVYYWSGSDIYYTKTGPKPLFGNNGIQSGYNTVKNDFHCNYILSNKYYNYNNQKFLVFLSKYTRIVFSNNDFAVYKVL